MFKLFKSKKGSALVYVMILAAVVSAIGTAGLAAAQNSNEQSIMSYNNRQAEMTARSILETVQKSINNSLRLHDFLGSDPNAEVTSNNHDDNLGDYQVKMKYVEGNTKKVEITVTAQYNGVEAEVSAIYSRDIDIVNVTAPPTEQPIQKGIWDNVVYTCGHGAASNIGASNIDGDLVYQEDRIDFSSGTTVTGNVSCRGDIHIGGGGNTISARPNTDSDGSIKSQGSVFIKEGANVSGGIYAKGDVSLSGAGSVGKDVKANGKVIIENGANVNKSVYAIKGFSISGSCTVGEDVYCNGNVELSGSSVIRGNVYIGGNLTMTGNPRIGGKVYCDGSINITGGEIVGDLICKGDAIFDWGIKVGGTAYIGGKVTRPQDCNEPARVEMAYGNIDGLLASGTKVPIAPTKVDVPRYNFDTWVVNDDIMNEMKENEFSVGSEIKKGVVTIDRNCTLTDVNLSSGDTIIINNMEKDVHIRIKEGNVGVDKKTFSFGDGVNIIIFDGDHKGQGQAKFDVFNVFIYFEEGISYQESSRQKILTSEVLNGGMNIEKVNTAQLKNDKYLTNLFMISMQKMNSDSEVKFEFDRQAFYLGNVYIPYGTCKVSGIELVDGYKYSGAIIAGRIETGQGVHLDYVAPRDESVSPCDPSALRPIYGDEDEERKVIGTREVVLNTWTCDKVVVQ